MFDYLAAFDENKTAQDIGIGEAIYIETGSAASNAGSINVHIMMRVFSGDLLEYEIRYMPINVSAHPLFEKEEWARRFNGSSVAYNLKPDTVKQILEHCTRLSKLNAFW